MKEKKEKKIERKCEHCACLYLHSETIRVYGDMWWTKKYCSAQCFTKREL